MFLESSKDILWLTLSFAVLWLTIFICWSMYYVISMMRTMNRITISVRQKIELIDKILHLVKDKLEKGSNHMSMIADSAIKMVGFMMDKHQKKAAAEEDEPKKTKKRTRKKATKRSSRKKKSE